MTQKGHVPPPLCWFDAGCRPGLPIKEEREGQGRPIKIQVPPNALPLVHSCIAPHYFCIFEYILLSQNSHWKLPPCIFHYILVYPICPSQIFQYIIGPLNCPSFIFQYVFVSQDRASCIFQCIPVISKLSKHCQNSGNAKPSSSARDRRPTGNTT